MEILMRNGGFFIAKFSDEDDLMNAMEGGPWLMAKRPIVLRLWNRGMRLEIERLETIPLLICFPTLPLHMWGTRLISKLASAIGKPLYMDSTTAGRPCIAFARVCVEISAHSELPDTILYREDNVWREIPVEYDWKPSPFKKCSTFGHSKAQCSVQGVPQAQSREKTTQHYVPVIRTGNAVASQDAYHLISSTQAINSLEEVPQAVVTQVLLEDSFIVKAVVESAIQETSGHIEVVGQNSVLKEDSTPNSEGGTNNRFSVLEIEDELPQEEEQINVEPNDCYRNSYH
ncbi:hypothetical protein QJS04_geneDACA012737 [Acorus gramineus]|uniref:DUF4283 domain-containing protein n=1 Tax=Acorus gramineus TaxID=55184 RepID=A0AAV8ZZK8_ACOGR|nr:hypothetical protein QJS04_geneDACA012737 [Acorus gramineus]